MAWSQAAAIISFLSMEGVVLTEHTALQFQKLDRFANISS
jgi:hypothetical protein